MARNSGNVTGRGLRPHPGNCLIKSDVGGQSSGQRGTRTGDRRVSRSCRTDSKDHRGAVGHAAEQRKATHRHGPGQHHHLQRAGIRLDGTHRAGRQTGANAFAAAYLSYRHRELEGQVANLRTGYERELSSIGNRSRSSLGRWDRSPAAFAALARLYFQLTQLRQQGTNISSSLASLANYNVGGERDQCRSAHHTRSGLGRKVILTLGILLGLLIGLVLASAETHSTIGCALQAQLERQAARESPRWRSSPRRSAVAGWPTGSGMRLGGRRRGGYADSRAADAVQRCVPR